MPISPELAQPLMAVAGLAIMCWVVMRGRARGARHNFSNPGSQQGKTSPQAASRHESFSGTSSLGAPSEVLKWQVELYDLGRELKAELDAKLIAVRAMTQAYDEAAARLRGAIDAAGRASGAESGHLRQAQRLFTAGWSQEKIAAALGLSSADVATLLQLQPQQDHSSASR